jgi:hypothetical protein
MRVQIHFVWVLQQDIRGIIISPSLILIPPTRSSLVSKPIPHWYVKGSFTLYNGLVHKINQKDALDCYLILC